MNEVFHFNYMILIITLPCISTPLALPVLRDPGAQFIFVSGYVNLGATAFKHMKEQYEKQH